LEPLKAYSSPRQRVINNYMDLKHLSAPKLKLSINLGLVVNLILAIIICFELYLVYSALYKKLNPESALIVFNKIVRVDLGSYNETAKLIESRQNFTPGPLDLKNSNPFIYHE
jgi:hypothetical protein